MVWFNWFGEKKTRNNELKKLVKLKKNEEFETNMKTLLPSDFADSSKTTLLHSAVKYNNLETMKFLLKSGSPINKQNSAGQTPLTVAVLYDRFKAIQLLLDADANIYLKDDTGKTPLEIAIRQRVPNYVIAHFFKILKKSGDNLESIAEIFSEAGCSIERILLLNDSELLAAILDRERSVNLQESGKLIRHTLHTINRQSVENLIVLTRHGVGQNFRKDVFLRELSYLVESSYPCLKYVKSLIDHLVNLNAIDDDLVYYFEKVFEKKKTKAVKLLLDCNVDVHVMKMFGRNLIAHLFGNRNVDAIELLKNRDLDLDLSGRSKLTALHFAVKMGLNKNVKYLLENNVDVNAKDNNGMTPLFYTGNIESVEILLNYGANCQEISDDGSSILKFNQCVIIQQMIMSQIAIIEAKGLDIKQEIYDSIYANKKLKNFYDECRMQIKMMKSTNILESVSLFSVLTEKTEKTARFMRNLKTNLTSDLSVYKRRLNWFYYSKLKGNLTTAMKIRILHCKAAKVIADSVKIIEADNLIVEKIISYLSHDDMILFK